VEDSAKFATKREGSGNPQSPYGIQAIRILNHRQLRESRALFPSNLILKQTKTMCKCGSYLQRKTFWPPLAGRPKNRLTPVKMLAVSKSAKNA